MSTDLTTWLVLSLFGSFRLPFHFNDLPVGRSVEETVRLIKAFQFVEKHGEVCPANWKEGSKSMKADPKGSLEYFSSVNTNGTVDGEEGARKRARVD